jgi:hypothetical protein
MLAQATRARITIVPNTRPYELDDDTGYLQHTLSREPVIIDGVTALVTAAAPEPDCVWGARTVSCALTCSVLGSIAVCRLLPRETPTLR